MERWLEFSRFSRLLSFMWDYQPRRARVFSFVRRVFTFLVFSALAGSSFLKFCHCFLVFLVLLASAGSCSFEFSRIFMVFSLASRIFLRFFVAARLIDKHHPTPELGD